MELYLFCSVALVLSTLPLAAQGQNTTDSAGGSGITTDAKPDSTGGAPVATKDETTMKDSVGATVAATDKTTTKDSVSKGGAPVAATDKITTKDSGPIDCHKCGTYGAMKPKCKTTKNNTMMSTCPEGECWIYKNSVGAYARGCKQTSSSEKAFKLCDDFKERKCLQVNKKKLCAKCCKTAKCNSGDLEGSAVIATSINDILLVTAAALVACITK